MWHSYHALGYARYWLKSKTVALCQVEGASEYRVPQRIVPEYPADYPVSPGKRRTPWLPFVMQKSRVTWVTWTNDNVACTFTGTMSGLALVDHAARIGVPHQGLTLTSLP